MFPKGWGPGEGTVRGLFDVFVGDFNVIILSADDPGRGWLGLSWGETHEMEPVCSHFCHCGEWGICGAVPFPFLRFVELFADTNRFFREEDEVDSLKNGKIYIYIKIEKDVSWTLFKRKRHSENIYDAASLCFLSFDFFRLRARAFNDSFGLRESNCMPREWSLGLSSPFLQNK